MSGRRSGRCFRTSLAGAAGRRPEGAKWRFLDFAISDLPERYGHRRTVYNRFNRWRKARVWDRLIDAIIKAHDSQVQMIDSSTVGIHQQADAKKQAGDACIGRSRGGLTTKPHLRLIGNGLRVQIELSSGQMNDQPTAELLFNDLPTGADVIADKGYDADWIRDLIED